MQELKRNLLTKLKTIERGDQYRANIGPELRAFRALQRQTLESFAEPLNIGIVYLSQIERGKNALTNTILKRLIKVLDQ